MSDAVVGALIGGAFTLTAGLLTAYRDDITAVLRRGRRKAKGHWRGTVSERMLPGSRKVWQEATIGMDLKQSGRRVWGVLYGTTSNGQKYRMKVHGRMEDDHFVTLEARAESAQELNFGMLVLDFDHKGRMLAGYALANGFEKHGVSLGTLELEKID